MSFRLKFNFKIHNKTNNHLKNIKILDDDGILHYDSLNTLDTEENKSLKDVYMHLYKPEKIYLKFLDDNNKEQTFLIFENIKKILKLQYNLTIEKNLNKEFNINLK